MAASRSKEELRDIDPATHVRDGRPGGKARMGIETRYQFGRARWIYGRREAGVMVMV
jgi:hypothetical protein